MKREQQLVALALSGLVLVTVGALLPWARIGGRNRSGFNTADTFVGLADGALPDWVAWVGRWWYVPAVLALLAWGTVFLSGSQPIRIVGVFLVVGAAAMWWVFVWAAASRNVFEVRLVGPVLSSVGLGIIGWCASRSRASTLANPSRPINGRSGSADG